MITLRQHVTSLVAVFLALAVGLVLGGAAFAGGDDGDGDDQPAATSGGSGSTDGGSATEPSGYAAYVDAFAGQGAGRLYLNGLANHAAAILALPGTDPATVESLQSQITVAGGATTGTYTISETLLDAAEESAVDDTATSLVTQLADPRVDPAAPTYERVGALIALAMSTKETSSVRADLAAVTVREALASAGYLESPTDVRNAPLVLVVLPPGDEGSGSEATAEVLSGLVDGLGTNAAGVVVAGDTVSARDGALAALRAGERVGPVSTVDGTDTAIGQVTTVLAMVAAVAGTTGSFGASGSDGAVPLG